ncbi:unnamed protein product [Urochloa humidicola]
MDGGDSSAESDSYRWQTASRLSRTRGPTPGDGGRTDPSPWRPIVGDGFRSGVCAGGVDQTAPFMFGSDELADVGNSLRAEGAGEIGLPLRVRLPVGKSSEGFQALQQSTPVLLLHALLLHKRVRLIVPSTTRRFIRGQTSICR